MASGILATLHEKSWKGIIHTRNMWYNRSPRQQDSQISEHVNDVGGFRALYTATESKTVTFRNGCKLLVRPTDVYAVAEVWVQQDYFKHPAIGIKKGRYRI